MAGTAIIAGRGALPQRLAQRCKITAQPYQVVRFDPEAEVWGKEHPGFQAHFSKFGDLFARLHAENISHVVFAGGVDRPTVNPAEFDAKTLEIAPRLLASLGRGDDATLREIALVFEEEGFEITAATALLPELIAPSGALGSLSPNPADLADIKRAAEIVAALGKVDVGQGAVVAQGICLGLESIQGTDQMLAFVAASGARFRPDPKGAKGVLWKAAKPGQDLRMDMPTLGLDTIAGALDAGLAGIAYRAGDVMILDLKATIKAADAAGLFLYGEG